MWTVIFIYVTQIFEIGLTVSNKDFPSPSVLKAREEKFDLIKLRRGQTLV